MLTRVAYSVVTRNIATFLVILILVVVPLIYLYLEDVRVLKSETIRAQMDAVAELGRFMLDADAVDQVRNPIWYGTVEHEDALRTLATIQANFQVDNAVLMRRAEGKLFTYIGDGGRQFAIGEPADVHQMFPATLPPAVSAWETGMPSETELFRTTDSSWFQVYTPLKVEDRVVALLLLNRFATPVADAIAERQQDILMLMAFALAGGIFVWWFVTSRGLRPLVRLRNATVEIAAGKLELEIPEYQSKSEIGALYDAFQTMVRDLRASRAEIEEYNRTLEDRIAQRTREIQTLLDNMDEGLFTISEDGTIYPRYSAATVQMLGGIDDSANFLERLTADEEARVTIRETFGLLLGGNLMLDWEDMVANLPKEFPGEEDKWLSARYRPVHGVDGESVERIMVILSDVTEQKQLQQDINANRDRQNMVIQIIQNRETFEMFYADSLALLDTAANTVAGLATARRAVVDDLFRTMHTIKGTAGLFGLHEVAVQAHQIEDILRDLGKGRDNELSAAEREDLAHRMTALRAALVDGRTGFQRLVGEDEAEPSVSIAESRLQQIIEEAAAAAGADSRDRVEKILARLKHVPAGRLLRKYRGLVEATADRLHKQAQLVLEDHGNTDLPPGFFQQVDPTFLHIIRNSLDHGIESPESRMEAGKPMPACITFTSSRENGGIRFTITDDGQGVNLSRIRDLAVERGFLKPERANGLARKDILGLLFLPGFSSKDAVTDLSGRGVGLDVVSKDVRRLHGSLRVVSRRGRGTTFDLYYPLPA